MSSATDLDIPRVDGENGFEGIESGDGARSTKDSIKEMGVVLGISVEVEIVLGSVKMPLSKLMQLSRGSVIPLDRKVGEPVDVIVNNKVVARGEVVILDEEQSRFGVCLTSVVGLSEDG